jgi:uncharacterized protein YdhG (YjbR/CyaY superfamily)
MRSTSPRTETSKPRSIDEYLASIPPAARRALMTVRRSIARALPEAEEVISYGIPAFKRNGRIVIYFAGWKEHFSLYPTTAKLTAAFKKELAPYDLSGKGTVRFSLSEPVPVRLIAALATFRDEEAQAAAQAKAAARKAARRKSRLTRS